MNVLYVGFTKQIELTKGGFLYMDDELPTIKRARIFDPQKHCFNPLKDIDYRKARELAELLYTIAPQGENTLTVRNGKRALLKAPLDAKSLDKVHGDEEVRGMIGDLLVSPVLRSQNCTMQHDGRRQSLMSQSYTAPWISARVAMRCARSAAGTSSSGH